MSINKIKMRFFINLYIILICTKYMYVHTYTNTYRYIRVKFYGGSDM